MVRGGFEHLYIHVEISLVTALILLLLKSVELTLVFA